MVSLGSFETVKTSEEFTYIYSKGKKWHCKCAVVFYKKTSDKKVGFVASKKLGNAIKRAKAKRRLRGIFLELQKSLKDGTYVFIAKEGINSLEYKECLSNLRWSFKKLECFDAN